MIELLLVVGGIIVLAAILFPRVRNVGERRRAQRAPQVGEIAAKVVGRLFLRAVGPQERSKRIAFYVTVVVEGQEREQPSSRTGAQRWQRPALPL